MVFTIYEYPPSLSFYTLADSRRKFGWYIGFQKGRRTVILAKLALGSASRNPEKTGFPLRGKDEGELFGHRILRKAQDVSPGKFTPTVVRDFSK